MYNSISGGFMITRFWGYTEIRGEFLEHIHKFRCGKLMIFMTILMFSNRQRRTKVSLEVIRRITGYSTNAIIRAISGLEQTIIHELPVLLVTYPDAAGAFTSKTYIVCPTPEEVQEHRRNEANG
jgi:hypothetical protein